MKIYTRKGDDGTTGLLHGGRVPKDSALPTAYGDVDEAQAVLGMARAEVSRGSAIDALLIALERDLWVLMAELATGPEHRDRLEEGTSLVTESMVTALESHIDEISEKFTLPTEFVVPGENRTSAALDLARTVVRRAERQALSAATHGSMVVPYLNRLSDLLWALARWQGGDSLSARGGPR